MRENKRRAGRFEALADRNMRVLIHAGALADEPRVSALLRSRGYREVRRFELRRVDFDGEPDPPAHVEGITVRGFHREEARRLYETHLEAFADHWGEGEETYEDSRSWAYAARIGAGGSGKRCCAKHSAPSMRVASVEPTCTSTPIRSPARRACTRGWA